MSRNFELLQRAQREQLFSRQPSVGTSAAAARASEPAPATTVTAPQDAFCPAFGKNVPAEMLQLAQRVFLATEASALRTAVFSGVQEFQDTGSIAVRACEALCMQTQGTVCLIDANLGSPSLHSIFGLDNGEGVATALEQGIPLLSFAHRLPGFNLLVVPSGPPIPGWQAALGSELMRSLLQSAASECAYLVIDAPAPSACPATASLGRAADGLLLVIDADSTRRELARKVVEDLEHSGVRLIGTVLNNRRFPIPEFLYSKL